MQWEQLVKYLIDTYVPTGTVLVDEVDLTAADRRWDLSIVNCGDCQRIRINEKASGGP